MAEKRKKKGVINEDKTCQLLHRYNATTIITLLQEVSLFVDVKIDWKAIVKTSSTGISNPREYQLLWRHLAYCEPLLDQVDGTEPKDDDSDLEFELEAEPAVSAEVSSQAVACVKVLMPSCLPRDIGSTKVPGVDARFSQERCNGQISSSADKGHLAHSACRKNITHGSVHKQAVTTTSFKKRKLWIEEEDTDLIAAVQKHGEGNWVTIKEEFKHNRNASQLSQRWSILKKKSSNTSRRTAPSETLLATREAVASALKMPMARSIAAIQTGVTQSTTPSNTPMFPSKPSEASHAIFSPRVPNSVQPPVSQAASQKGTSTSSSKLRTIPETPSTPVKSLVGPNSLIQAAAFAAGGRIVTPSTAATYLKAAPAKNVHIIHGGARLASANKGRSQLTYSPNRPFVIPPPPGNSFKSPNGAKVGSTNLLTATELNCKKAQANVEKISGASDREEGGLPKKVAEGGESMELDVATNQDPKKALDVGVNDSSTTKDPVDPRSKEEDR